MSHTDKLTCRWRGMADRSVNTGALEDSAKPAAPARPAGLRGFMAGMMLPLGVAFAILGGGQVGLSVLFLLNGHAAVVLPRDQPSEALSISIGGWLPFGACGAVMVLLAWVTVRVATRGR
jgi:hypothetical protein